MEAQGSSPSPHKSCTCLDLVTDAVAVLQCCQQNLQQQHCHFQLLNTGGQDVLWIEVSQRTVGPQQEQPQLLGQEVVQHLVLQWETAIWILDCAKW